MNFALDELVRRTVADPDFLERARAAPGPAAASAGVVLPDLRAVLDGDLATLHRRGAHPLLIMRLASALGIDAMSHFSQRSTGAREMS